MKKVLTMSWPEARSFLLVFGYLGWWFFCFVIEPLARVQREKLRLQWHNENRPDIDTENYAYLTTLKWQQKETFQDYIDSPLILFLVLFAPLLAIGLLRFAYLGWKSFQRWADTFSHLG